jgi:hypothetical protein
MQICLAAPAAVAAVTTLLAAMLESWICVGDVPLNDARSPDVTAAVPPPTEHPTSVTFPNTQLTKAFSNPDQSGDPNWMGDYTGNTWAGGDFIAAWMDSSNGVDMQEVIGGIRLH